MDWRFSTFILFLFSMLFGITWATSDTGLCHSDFVQDVLARKDKDGAYSCFEFWFNRYQTLLGVVATAGAAIYAGWWVSKQVERTDAQIKQMDAQSRLMGQQTAAVRINQISVLIDEADDLINKIPEIYKYYDSAVKTQRDILVLIFGPDGYREELDDYQKEIPRFKGNDAAYVEKMVEKLNTIALKCRDIADELNRTAPAIKRLSQMSIVRSDLNECEVSLRSFSKAQIELRKCEIIWSDLDFVEFDLDAVLIARRRFKLSRPQRLVPLSDLTTPLQSLSAHLRNQLANATDELIGNRTSPKTK